ncbi:MAG: lysylphosphatidylglycerol synthase transmembrane domain-containing protein [Bacteroidota bacterium]
MSLNKSPEPSSPPTSKPESQHAERLVQENEQEALSSFRFRRILIPLLIGIGVLGYAGYQLVQDGLNPITDIPWDGWVLGMIGLGFLFMAIRDLGYVWRMRLLTDQQLSWRASTEVTLLWEFASAASPSIVGGSAVGIYLLIKEKISAGRTTAIIFITIFLDELFYILSIPTVMLFADQEAIFAPMQGESSSFLGAGMVVGFWIAYGILVAYTFFLAFALFIKPEKTSQLVRWLFSTRLFRKWKDGGQKTAEELLTAAKEFQTRSLVYWLKTFFATSLAWMGRYLVLNCVLAAFVVMSWSEHVVAFTRQTVMFVLMLVSPTPGSSGIAETVFGRLFSEYANRADHLPPDMVEGVGFVWLLASIWRLITYYPYLFIGIPLMSIWVRRVNRKSK